MTYLKICLRKTKVSMMDFQDITKSKLARLGIAGMIVSFIIGIIFVIIYVGVTKDDLPFKDSTCLFNDRNNVTVEACNESVIVEVDKTFEVGVRYKCYYHESDCTNIKWEVKRGKEFQSAGLIFMFIFLAFMMLVCLGMYSLRKREKLMNISQDIDKCNNNVN